MITLTTAPRCARRARSDRVARSPRGAQRGFQIGPRIRVGGTIGHAAQKLKEGVGKVEKAIAPAAMLIPGVGQIAAPILNTAGHLFDTSDGGVHLNTLPKLALEDAGLYGGGKLAGALEGKLANTGVGQSVLGKFGLGSKVPVGDAGYGGVSFVPGPGGSSIPMPSSIPGVTNGASWFDRAKSAFGNFMGGGNGGSGDNGSTLDKLLLGAGVVDSALQRKKQQGLLNKGEGYATAPFDAKAPLRNTTLGVLENNFTNSPNPYTQRYLSAKTPVGD